MREVVAILAVACLCGCQFNRAANAGGEKGAPSKPQTQDHGGSGGSAPSDSGNNGSGGSGATAGSGGTAATVDAGHSGKPVNPGDGGAAGDAGKFGDDPTPHDTKPPDQNGGLKCGDVFCPFADKPIEPCCTQDADVKIGAAIAKNKCGLQFKATGSDFFADHCWQRDQPGVPDDMCPGVQVDLHSTDPGCCNGSGKCGGVDSDHGLGCHADPGETAQSCGIVPGADGGAAMCDPRGVYAMKLSVELAWGGRSGGLVGLTDDGRGTLDVQLLAKIDKVDDDTMDMSGTMRVCGVSLPTFYSTTLCEAYQPIFPPEMFDSKAIPVFDIGGHMQCLQPGCLASIDAQTYLLGIELNNPEAPWPTADQTTMLTCKSGKGMQCFPDQDGDMRPGLTVGVATTGTSTEGTGCNSKYANKGAPLSASIGAIFDGVRRTNRIQLGVRMKIGASMKFGDDCVTGNGAGIAEFVNSRAWGCLAQPGTFDFPYGMRAGANDPCTASEASFMDANLPIYEVLDVGETPASNLNLKNKTPSLGPQVKLVRLGDADADVSCEQVRSAMYP